MDEAPTASSGEDAGALKCMTISLSEFAHECILTTKKNHMINGLQSFECLESLPAKQMQSFKLEVYHLGCSPSTIGKTPHRLLKVWPTLTGQVLLHSFLERYCWFQYLFGTMAPIDLETRFVFCCSKTDVEHIFLNHQNQSNPNPTTLWWMMQILGVLAPISIPNSSHQGFTLLL